MRRRLTVLVAVLVAVVLAAVVLWPEPDDTNKTLRGDTTTTTNAPFVRRIDLVAGPLRSGQEGTFVVSFVNNAAPVTVTFGTSQDADVVLRRDGATVWRWSADRAFTQAMRSVSFGRGPHLFTLKGVLNDVAPGRYLAIATLTGTPAPPPATLYVTVE